MCHEILQCIAGRTPPASGYTSRARHVATGRTGSTRPFHEAVTVGHGVPDTVGRSSDSQAADVRDIGPNGRRFPGIKAQCVVTAVVPAHRCGTVPDSHRIPSHTRTPEGGRASTPGAVFGAPHDRTGRTSCTVQHRQTTRIRHRQPWVSKLPLCVVDESLDSSTTHKWRSRL